MTSDKTQRAQVSAQPRVVFLDVERGVGGIAAFTPEAARDLAAELLRAANVAEGYEPA